MRQLLGPPLIMLAKNPTVRQGALQHFVSRAIQARTSSLQGLAVLRRSCIKRSLSFSEARMHHPIQP